MTKSQVNCYVCSKSFSKENKHINENLKFGYSFFCSSKCQFTFKTKQIKLICENVGCNNKFKRSRCDISPHNFCSQSCFAIFNNANHPKSPKAIRNVLKKKVWDSLTEEQKIKRKLEGSRLGGKNRWLNYTSQYNKELIIHAIQKFVNKYKRLPVKREMNRFYRPTRFYFGSWNNAIKAAGFKPNPVLFADKCIAKDGHVCDSIAEMVIDNYLYEKNIQHERNVFYPGGIYTADFKISARWIEYFGLAGEHRRYDELRLIKQQLAAKYKLNLLEIYPKDLYPKNKLESILGY